MIEFDEKRISINTDKAGFEILWDEIYKVNYYKYDCISKEVACLCFDYEYGEFVEVFEDMPGWTSLIEKLHELLPLKNEKWYDDLKNISSKDEPIEIYKKIGPETMQKSI